jgi:hypothetical protein
MPKRSHQRPEVERLDSLTLLSSIAAAAPQVTGIGSMQLTGTLKGITSTQGNPTFHATGELSPIGSVKAAGHGSIATVTGPTGAFNLRTPIGKVYVGTDVESAGKRTYSGEYRIEGGTAAYSGDSGSGSFVVSYTGYRFIATFGEQALR